MVSVSFIIIIIQLNCILLAYGNECKHLKDLKKKKLKVKRNYNGMAEINDLFEIKGAIFCCITLQKYENCIFGC